MRALTKKNLMILGSILLTFIIVQALLLVGILDSFHEITISTICINIILAVSLNLVTGFTGQLSLGHAGFMSIGAYVCALISSIILLAALPTESMVNAENRNGSIAPINKPAITRGDSKLISWSSAT
jgi:ABC-type branched-subunit amino acid transport system permease subunit